MDEPYRHHRPDFAHEPTELTASVGDAFYHCNCGSRSVLDRMYFCRTCVAVRCVYCISNDVDLLSCPNCLSHIPSPEARHRKNRCSHCYECPICFNPLFTRATAVAPSNVEESVAPDGKAGTASRKAYYLACAQCRWTSRDVGLSDRPASSCPSWSDEGDGKAEEKEEQVDRFEELISHHKAWAQREMLIERDTTFGKNGHYLSGYRMASYVQSMAMVSSKSPDELRAAMEARNRNQHRLMALLGAKAQTLQSTESNPLAAVNPYEEPPPITSPSVAVTAEELVGASQAQLASSDNNNDTAATVEQRLRQWTEGGSSWPVDVADLRPHHLPLVAQLSARCSVCSHTLFKAEFKPSSMRFPVRLTAPLHVPRIVLEANSAAVDRQRGIVKFAIYIVNPSYCKTEASLAAEKRAAPKADEPHAKPYASGGLDIVRPVDIVATAPVVSPYRASLVTSGRLGPFPVGSYDETAILDGGAGFQHNRLPNATLVDLTACIDCGSGGQPINLDARGCFVTFVMAFTFTDTVLATLKSGGVDSGRPHQQTVEVEITLRII